MSKISCLLLGLGSFPALSQSDPATRAPTAPAKQGFAAMLRDKECWEWGGKAGGSAQGYEAGISRCNWRGLPFGMMTVSVLNEFPRGVTWVNPKVSAEIGFFFLAARLSAVDYTNWTQHEVRVRPEYGFSFLGFANVMYHRDLFLSTRRFDIAPQGWSLTLNFPSNPKNYTYF